MTLVFGVPLSVLLGQLLLGLINGAFYALLSLGLAIIFGLLRIINFAHGAQYMLGAFVAFLGLNYLGVSYWFALVVAHGGLEQAVLVAKIVADDAVGYPGKPRDIGDAGIAHADLIDGFKGCRNQLRAADGLHADLGHLHLR